MINQGKIIAYVDMATADNCPSCPYGLHGQRCFIKILKKDQNGTSSLILWFQSPIEAHIRLGQICSKIVLNVGTNCSPYIIHGAVIENHIVYAIPGRTGSITNQLIKNGAAYLCDSITDIDKTPDWKPKFIYGDPITEDEESDEL